MGETFVFQRNQSYPQDDVVRPFYDTKYSEFKEKDTHRGWLHKTLAKP
jgi:hypothetical protein